MQPVTEQKPAEFADRRDSDSSVDTRGVDRRQFTNSYDASQPEVAELAEAIDQYKLRHRRRFITFEELFDVIIDLGYRR